MFPSAPELVEVERLGNEICELAAHIEAAKARLLGLVASFDALDGGLSDGCRSTAHWLNWRCGVSLHDAHEQVRVARALDERPAVAAAFAAGEVSYAKARAMCRAPSTAIDDELVELAKSSTTAQLEEVVRAWRRADASDNVDASERRRAEQFVTSRYDDEGNLTGRYRLVGDAGALFLKALEAGREELRSADADA